jgi:hypothetical protein
MHFIVFSEVHVSLAVYTCVAGTAYLSGVPKFTPVFSEVHVSLAVYTCVAGTAYLSGVRKKITGWISVCSKVLTSDH